MDRKRYKPNPRRTSGLEEDEHWLGMGLDGPDSLFLELDPYLYRADGPICQLARTLLFSNRDFGQKPPAIVFPPADGVGYLQGVLSEGFSVTVCSETGDLLLDDVVQQFGNVSVIGRVPDYLHGSTALVIHCDTAWTDLDALLQAVWMGHSYLHEDGVQVAVLRGLIRDGGQSIINWSDGSETPLEDLFDVTVGRERVEPEFEELPFADLTVRGEDYLNAFLRRHRALFGRASRGTCLSRMHDPDFAECLTGAGSQLRSAVLMTIDGSNRPKEERAGG